MPIIHVVQSDLAAIRKEAKFVRDNEGTESRRFSWAERLAAELIVQLCNMLENANGLLKEVAFERDCALKDYRREKKVLDGIVNGHSPATLYWIDEDRVYCRYCSFEAELAADVKHDDDCGLVAAYWSQQNHAD